MMMFPVQRVLITLTILLTGCLGSGTGTTVSTPPSATPQSLVTPVVSAVVAPVVSPSAPSAVPPTAVTTYPPLSNALLTNPFQGLVRYVGALPTVSTLPQTLAYNNLTWKTLEPNVKGTFDWVAFETAWAGEIAQGRRIGFRLNVSFPNATPHDDIPAWLIAAGVPVQAYSTGGTFGSVPDWNNATFLAEHDRVIAALGARYNNDPRIAWVDVGSYGIWGEWHQFGATPAPLTPTNVTKKRILDAYLLAFPNKRLVLPYGDAYATQYFTQNRGGLRNDCLGPLASNNAYLTMVNPMPSAASNVLYQTAPITGEFCNGAAGVTTAMTTDYAQTLAFIQSTHWSWIGPTVGDLLNPITLPLANAQQLHNTLGYRFRVASITHLPSVTRNVATSISAQLQNDGIAPFYEAWPVEISLINAAGVVAWSSTMPTWDVRTWLPGVTNLSANVSIPLTLPAGTYTVAIAVLDPNPVPPTAANLPALEFAQTGKRTDGRYPLSSVQVN